ncbi:5'-3' exoribonuclease 2, partial [Fragariocoptes setiger]
MASSAMERHKICYESNEKILSAYANLVANDQIKEDDFQLRLVARLQELDNDLAPYHPVSQNILYRIIGRRNVVKPKGLYIYGSVGCGKTFLMDLFYDNCSVSDKFKTRVHFHEFMLDVHQRIHETKSKRAHARTGREVLQFNPIPYVAKLLSSEAWLICLDEFQVIDIGDAMILKQLFSHLFEEGVILLATSNRPPDDLYKSGLQRSAFLPFIPMLKENCSVLCLDSNVDYRKKSQPVKKIYLLTTNPNHERDLDNLFKIISTGENDIVRPRTLIVKNRQVHMSKTCGGIADCTFEELCEQPLGAIDYLLISRIFHTVIIRNIPQFDLKRKSAARRFITLIDSFYDAKIRVIFSAHVPLSQLFNFRIESAQKEHMNEENNRVLLDDLGLDQDDSKISLFTGEEEAFAFDRTISRISEMQTVSWWQRKDNTNCFRLSMGIPAFFRWLSRKYPITEPADSRVLDDETGEQLWIDNLYLDMNGIIHPCTHPENKPPPQTEEEMFDAIYEYTEMVMQITKPRQLVYMAIDGVAPRAKMNQQRSRRFRAGRESDDKKKLIDTVRQRLRNEGVALPPTKSEAMFDSNVITPGTQFMTNLSLALQRWIKHKISTHDPTGLWHKDLTIILSDASVPGEGEHKIMEYLRESKKSPNYDPSLRHCLYGADADLIMLGLATHEKHFIILREEFQPNQSRPCDLCRLYGHELKDCTGSDVEPRGARPLRSGEPDFVYIKLNAIRQNLKKDLLEMSSIPLDFERYIDDFVFLCFFVGNDFLPHLPSLEIRENAIDNLLRIYHELNSQKSGYLTNNGEVNLQRCQEILTVLGPSEEAIFKKRAESDRRFHSRRSAQKKARWQAENNNYNDSDYPRSPERPDDYVRLGEEGWKERYYLEKMGPFSPIETAKQVTKEYIRGLCWVLKYYYQGCPDWKWFFPYHYAPFACDMKNITDIKLNFNKDAPPFKPLEQLMGVFPAASADALPVSWRKLMTDPNSPIRDFYPEEFTIDLNGKSAAWMGVALLPFIDENRLLSALETVYPDLTEDEIRRNSTGTVLTFKCTGTS